MEFEIKEVNGSTVYVRKNKKVVKQREDFPGDKTLASNSMFAAMMKIIHESDGCTHNCASCHADCSANEVIDNTIQTK